ncbi:DNA/RNA non-specific endonuclease [Bacillus safensis]
MNSQINRSGGKWYEMEQRWLKGLRADPPKHVATTYLRGKFVKT